MILFLAATYIAPSGIGPGEPLEALVGQRVDIAPWTYEWRADRAIQPRPEAEFIPRRLERVDGRLGHHAFAAGSGEPLGEAHDAEGQRQDDANEQDDLGKAEFFFFLIFIDVHVRCVILLCA